MCYNNSYLLRLSINHRQIFVLETAEVSVRAEQYMSMTEWEGRCQKWKFCDSLLLAFRTEETIHQSGLMDEDTGKKGLWKKYFLEEIFKCSYSVLKMQMWTLHWCMISKNETDPFIIKSQWRAKRKIGTNEKYFKNVFNVRWWHNVVFTPPPYLCWRWLYSIDAKILSSCLLSYMKP